MRIRFLRRTFLAGEWVKRGRTRDLPPERAAFLIENGSAVDADEWESRPRRRRGRRFLRAVGRILRDVVVRRFLP